MIYFVQSNNSGPIKIGYTKNKYSVHKRLGSIQVGSSEPLKLLGLINGSRKDEQLLHKKFHVYQLHGEWFQPSKTLLNFIFNACGIKLDTHEIYNTEKLKDLNFLSLNQVMIEIEIDYIKTALNHTNYNKTAAAKLLRISFDSLRYKMEKFEI